MLKEDRGTVENAFLLHLGGEIKRGHTENSPFRREFQTSRLRSMGFFRLGAHAVTDWRSYPVLFQSKV
jgi:hypothetical protein